MVYNDRAAAKGILAHPKSAPVHLSKGLPSIPEGEPSQIIMSFYGAVCNRCFSHSTVYCEVTAFVAVSLHLHLGFL